MNRNTAGIFVLFVLFALGVMPAAAQSARSAPENDDFGWRRGITWTQTHTLEIMEATRQINEPQHPCFAAPAEDSVWYEFYVPAGTITLSTHNSTGSASDMVMTIWQGATLANLTAIECDDDDGVVNHAYINRSLAAGTYILQVSRASIVGAAVAGTLHVNMDFDPIGDAPANDSMANAIPLTVPGIATISNIVNAGSNAAEVTQHCDITAHPHSVHYTFTLAQAGRVRLTFTDVIGSVSPLLAVYRNLGDGTYTYSGCTGGSKTWSGDLSAGNYHVVLGTQHKNGYTDASVFTFDIGVDLIINGGFEAGLDGWTIVKQTGDKAKCNSTSGKEITKWGDCAMMFKGGGGEKAILGQPVVVPEWLDSLDNPVISPAFRAKSKNGTKLKLVIEALDVSGGSTKCVLKHQTGNPQNWYYNAKSCPVSKHTVGAIVTFKHKSTSGKVILDRVEIVLTESLPVERGANGPAALPPPVAPAGFRGGN